MTDVWSIIWPTSHCQFCPDHIFSVALMAILSIDFFFLTLSTLVFKSRAKIRVSDLIKLFFSRRYFQLFRQNLLVAYLKDCL